MSTKKREAELSPVETSDDDDVVETSDDDDEDVEPEVIADSSNRNRTGVVLPMLMELLSMKIFDTKQPKGDPIKVYGSFHIDDVEGKMTLFKEGKENSMSISSDGSLPLVSPSRCIVGSSLGLFICLKNHNNDHDLGNAYFAMTNQWESKEKEWFFDRPVSACFAGEHGYTMLNFIVFQKAVQADIDIKLHDDNMLVGNQENFVHDVYGQIMYKIEDLIYVSAYEKKHYRTMAFDVPEDEPVQLKPGAAIPLSKHVVAVPYNSYLEIVATLWISGTQVSRTISFDPAVSGCREVLVNKAISLKVTWYTPQPWLKVEPKGPTAHN